MWPGQHFWVSFCGVDEAVVYLNCAGTPDAPTNVMLSLLNYTNILVSWDAPNSEVTTYVVSNSLQAIVRACVRVCVRACALCMHACNVYSGSLKLVVVWFPSRLRNSEPIYAGGFRGGKGQGYVAFMCVGSGGGGDFCAMQVCREYSLGMTILLTASLLSVVKLFFAWTASLECQRIELGTTWYVYSMLYTFVKEHFTGQFGHWHFEPFSKALYCSSVGYNSRFSAIWP